MKRMHEPAACPEPDSSDREQLRDSETDLPGIERHHSRRLLAGAATVHSDGTARLPAWLAVALGVPDGGEAEVTAELTTDGCILIRPPAGVDPEQWWFRTRAWTDEAGADTGAPHVFEDVEAFAQWLEAGSSQS